MAWQERPDGKQFHLLALDANSTLRVWNVRDFLPTSEDMDDLDDRVIIVQLPFDIVGPSGTRILHFDFLTRHPETVLLALSSGIIATIQLNRTGEPQVKYQNLNEDLVHTAITADGKLSMYTQAKADTLYELSVHEDVESATATRVPIQANHTFKNIRAAGERTVIFGADRLMSWTDDPTSATSLPCEDLHDVLLSKDGTLMLLQQGSDIHVMDCSRMVSILKHTPPAQPSFLKITPDGEYFVYVYAGKEIRLVRIRDALVIAWYTMITAIHSFEVSSNGWFVLAGTSDRRLFVLLIADIENPSTKGRLQLLREYNAPMDKLQTEQLVTEAAKFDDSSSGSDDTDIAFGGMDSGSESEMSVMSGISMASERKRSSRKSTKTTASKGHQVIDMSTRPLSRSKTAENLKWKMKMLLMDSENPSAESAVTRPHNLDIEVDDSVPKQSGVVMMTPRICSLQ